MRQNIQSCYLFSSIVSNYVPFGHFAVYIIEVYIAVYIIEEDVCMEVKCRLLVGQKGNIIEL